MDDSLPYFHIKNDKSWNSYSSLWRIYVWQSYLIDVYCVWILTQESFISAVPC